MHQVHWSLVTRCVTSQTPGRAGNVPEAAATISVLFSARSFFFLMILPDDLGEQQLE